MYVTHLSTGIHGMHLRTILNHVEKRKSFVYGAARSCRKGEAVSIEVDVHPRRNSRPVCSGCGRQGPQYDRLKARRFEFVPLWSMAVYFVYRMRRVDCAGCGVTVERFPGGTVNAI